MARTKQTARYATTQVVPRRQIQQVNSSSRGRGRGRTQRSGSRSRSLSQQSQKSVDFNTQQFSVKFDNQKECEKQALDFKVVECPKCGAFLNSHSVIIQKEAKKSVERNMNDVQKQLYKAHLGKEWQCEFCKSINSLPEDFEKLPQENQCYLLEKSKGESSIKEESERQNLLLYCVDVSGSMDMEFQGKSRLSAVKEAIIDQLKRMKFEKDKVKISVVTFGSLVTLKTQTNTINIPAQHYNNFDAIVHYSQSLDNLSFSLDASFKNLKEYIGEMQTYGSTALGPALVSSIELCSRGRKGSKIILCTDGQANVGLNGTQFYSKAAEYAKQKGVVVNILSLKGDKCNLKELGKLTLSTGGSILKIDPNLLGGEFNKISKEEVLGSQSVLRIIVNKLFEIENGVGELSKDKTTLIQNYGSFTADTQLTFNFKVLSKQQATTKGINFDLFANKKAPMQVQLTYTTPSGSKYLQVITDYRQLSENKEDIFKQMNFGLYAASTLQKVSGLIRDERFEQAEAQIKTYDRVVEEYFSKEDKKQLDKFNNRIRKLSKILESKKNKKVKGPVGKQKRKAIKSKSRRRKGSESDQQQEEDDVRSQMSSDSEEAVLFRQMRARSRSRSRSR